MLGFSGYGYSRVADGLPSGDLFRITVFAGMTEMSFSLTLALSLRERGFSTRE